MSDTPNTTGPSAEAHDLAQYAYQHRDDYPAPFRFNLACRIDAALSRAREEARKEAFEQAGWACLALSEGGDLAATCARRMAELARKEADRE